VLACTRVRACPPRGRYRDIDAERRAARTVYPLGLSALDSSHAPAPRLLAPLVDAQYARHFRAVTSAELEVRVSPTGLSCAT